MRSRRELVSELIRNPRIETTLLDELASYGWDSEVELGTITQDDVCAVLAQLQSGALSAQEVHAWANRIEGRDDVAFQFGSEGVVNEAIFWLANPHINWPINNDLCQKIESMFLTGRYELSGP